MPLGSLTVEMTEKILTLPGLSKLSHASSLFFKEDVERWKENSDDGAHCGHSAAPCVHTHTRWRIP